MRTEHTAGSTVPRTVVADPVRGPSERVRRGEEQRRALRDLVMGGASGREQIDPRAPAAAARWWQRQAWIPRELTGGLDQIARSCARLVGHPDGALSFEVSRMALSLRGALSEALAAAGVPDASTFGRSITQACSSCDSTVSGIARTDDGLELVECCCAACGLTVLSAWSTFERPPRLRVDHGRLKLSLDGVEAMTASYRHGNNVVLATASSSGLAPVVARLPVDSR